MWRCSRKPKRDGGQIIRAEPECAISIRAAGGGPPISTAWLSPPGSAGSFKPMAAPIPSPAATASCGLRASPGAAAPATSGERPGRCREQAARAPLADAVREAAAPATAITPPSSGRRPPCRARRAGWPGWLVTQASSPGDAGQQGRNILLKAALPASWRKTNRTENPGGCLVLPHHTTRNRGRPGRCRPPGHPESCRICPHPPQTFELPRSPRRFDVPWVSRSRVGRILVIPRAGSGWFEVVFDQVSMPGAE